MQARNERAQKKNNNSIRFVDPYIVFKAPQAVWTASHESLHQSYEVIREPKRKIKNTLPLQLRVSYIVIKLLIITRLGFYIVIGLTIYMCKQLLLDTDGH